MSVQLSDGTEGRVAETDWRSMNLLSRAHNKTVLPNDAMAIEVDLLISGGERPFAHQTSLLKSDPGVSAR
ncbi:hypothetical protein GOD01_12965 [Sinorhizobium medicae]|nr:hypothetical protein [Sinorhizobium medicae]